MRRTTKLFWSISLLSLQFMGCNPQVHKEPLKPQPTVFWDIAPRWSRDGRYIAFLRATPDARYQLCLADARLQHITPLLPPETLNPDRPFDASKESYSTPDQLEWSPDDRHIVLERVEWFRFEDGERLPGTGLWMLDVATGVLTPVALHKTPYTSLFYFYHTPKWSPDGRYLAFIGEGINGQRALFLHPFHAHQLPQQIPPRFDVYTQTDWPAWCPLMPNSKHRQPVLAFRQGIVHALAMPNTETIRRLQPGSASPGSAGEILRVELRRYLRMVPPNQQLQNAALRISGLVWSPDGRRLAFALTPDALDFNLYALWVVDADGHHLKRVSPLDGKGYFAPEWVGNDQIGALSPSKNRFNVVLFDLFTGRSRVLGSIDSADVDWSPDRSRLVYATLKPRSLSAGGSTLRVLETGLYAGTQVAAMPVPKKLAGIKD